MMRITVTGRHMTLGESLRVYAGEKTERLERFYDRVLSADVVFDTQPNAHLCEIIVKGDHHTTFVAKEAHEDPFAALDAAVKDLERQLSRHKEKFRNRKHPDDQVEREPLAGPGLEGASSS
jgi:putative sigma-54 modulation protein